MKPRDVRTHYHWARRKTGGTSDAGCRSLRFEIPEGVAKVEAAGMSYDEIFGREPPS